MAAYCCKPCEYLGKCIDKGCECGCKFCGAVCTKPCQCLGEFFCPPDRPSPIFLTYSAVVCGIPAVVAVIGMASGTDCGNLMVFFGAMAAINLLLIAFAFYLYKQFSKPYGGSDPQGNTETNPMARASNMFCYDPVVFFYLLTIGAGVVLSIMGAIWSGGCGSGSAEKNAENNSAKDSADAVMFLFWTYIFGGMCVICLSLCVECGRQQQQQQQQQPARTSGFMGMAGGGLVQRLFFPRANVTAVGGGGGGGGAGGGRPAFVPYAQPAPPPAQYPTTQAPTTQNTLPQAAPASLPMAQEPVQQPAQGAGATAASLAAKGLRFGANMLEKANAKK